MPPRPKRKPILHPLLSLLHEARRTVPFPLLCRMDGAGRSQRVAFEAPLKMAMLASLRNRNLLPKAEQVKGQAQLGDSILWSHLQPLRETFTRFKRAVGTLSRPTRARTALGRPTVLFNYSTGTRQKEGEAAPNAGESLRLGRYTINRPLYVGSVPSWLTNTLR